MGDRDQPQRLCADGFIACLLPTLRGRQAQRTEPRAHASPRLRHKGNSPQSEELFVPGCQMPNSTDAKCSENVGSAQLDCGQSGGRNRPLGRGNGMSQPRNAGHCVYRSERNAVHRSGQQYGDTDRLSVFSFGAALHRAVSSQRRSDSQEAGPRSLPGVDRSEPVAQRGTAIACAPCRHNGKPRRNHATPVFVCWAMRCPCRPRCGKACSRPSSSGLCQFSR